MTRRLAPVVHTLVCFHDADRSHLHLLDSHLAPLCRANLMTLWHTDKLRAGDNREQQFRAHLEKAQIILFLVSADFNAEWGARIYSALRHRDPREAIVVPVLLRPCTWTDMPYFGLNPIPKNGKPLVVGGAADESQVAAFADEIRSLVLTVRVARPEDQPKSTVAHSALFATLAQIERERHRLDTRLQTIFAQCGSHPQISTSEDEVAPVSLPSASILGAISSVPCFTVSPKCLMPYVALPPPTRQPAAELDLPATSPISQPTYDDVMRAFEQVHVSLTSWLGVTGSLEFELVEAANTCTDQLTHIRAITALDVPPDAECPLTPDGTMGVLNVLWKEIHHTDLARLPVGLVSNRVRRLMALLVAAATRAAVNFGLSHIRYLRGDVDEGARLLREALTVVKDVAIIAGALNARVATAQPGNAADGASRRS